MRSRGGAAKARDVCDLVAKMVELSAEDLAARITITGHSYNDFEREVRWAQQRAKLQGLLMPADSGLWAHTDKGSSALRKATPGLIVTIFTTEKGAALWGHCEDAVGLLEDESYQPIFSSPPYPLLRKKEYSNEDEPSYVEWLLRAAPRMAQEAGQVRFRRLEPCRCLAAR